MPHSPFFNQILILIPLPRALHMYMYEIPLYLNFDPTSPRTPPRQKAVRVSYLSYNLYLDLDLDLPASPPNAGPMAA